MVIEKKKFRSYRTDQEKAKDKHKTVAVKFNIKTEQPKLELIKELLQVEETGVAIKQSIEIALEVILEQKTLVITSHILNNYRRNKRKGVVTFDDTNYQKYINGNRRIQL